MTRAADLTRIAVLPTDEARWQAYLSQVTFDVAAHPRLVVMCACDDWLTCDHPWPRRLDAWKDSGLDLRPAHRFPE